MSGVDNMTRTFDYPNCVDKDNIEIIEGDIPNTKYRWRAALIIQLIKRDSDTDKIITFLMKNPSAADKSCCDKTILNVINYVERLKESDERFAGVSEIRIINLFSIYSTDSSDLFDIISKINNHSAIQEINNEVIRNMLRDTDIIVPSWGKKPKNVVGRDNPYRERADQVLRLISQEYEDKQIYLIKFNKKRTLYPIHPERIGYKGELIKKFKLNPCVIKGDFFCT
jgi:hypothetical protein